MKNASGEFSVFLEYGTWRVSTCVTCNLLRIAIWDGGCFGAPPAGGYKWQYILIAAFFSFVH